MSTATETKPAAKRPSRTAAARAKRVLNAHWPPEAEELIPRESTEFAIVSEDGPKPRRYAEVRYRCMAPWQEHTMMRLYASVTEQGVVLTVKTEERVLACVTVPRPVLVRPRRRRK